MYLLKIIIISSNNNKDTEGAAILVNPGAFDITESLSEKY